MFRIVLIAFALTTRAFPQAMLEHAIAASGGSAAGMAGKPVSDGAEAALVKAGSLLDRAAADRPVKHEPQKPAGRTTYAVMPPAPPLPEVVPESFRQIRPGLKREELLANVGMPSSRITIPESGQTVEIYRYRANGGTLGSVRLVDGKVTEIIQ